MTQKNLFLLLLLLTLHFSFGQNKEDRNGNLIGYITKLDLQQGKYKTWFKKNYEQYKPNTKIVNKLKKKLEGITVITFAGTWCHDSKRELPRFYKIMEQAEFDLSNNFKLVGITRGKKTPDNLQEGYDVKHTPTFIFLKNGKEIGRFVEHSKSLLEKDMLTIVSGKKYKHSYQK